VVEPEPDAARLVHHRVAFGPRAAVFRRKFDFHARPRGHARKHIVERLITAHAQRKMMRPDADLAIELDKAGWVGDLPCQLSFCPPEERDRAVPESVPE
jgi:hypothetical protein